MIGDMMLNEMDKELDAWINMITFSRQMKNLSRDFSDAGNYQFYFDRCYFLSFFFKSINSAVRKSQKQNNLHFNPVSNIKDEFIS